MFCKFCGSEMPDDVKTCPECGKQVSADGWKISVVVLCALILAAVLVVVVLYGTGVLGGKDAEESTPAVSTEPTQSSVPEESTPDIVYDSYTVEDALAAQKADEVVATLGDMQLTNSELQLHYWYQVYEFLNQNYYYLSMIGMDLSKGLDQQACYFEDSMSWQKYFLEQALEGWKGYATLCQLAKVNDFQLSEEGQEYMANIRDSLESDAKLYNYESVEDMILKEAGPGCTIDGFVSYREMMYLSMQYFNQEYTAMTPTDEEAAAYYEENAADYEAAGVTKDSGVMSAVRHILIAPEGGTTENNVTTYSDEEWAAAEKEAQRVLQLWKDGDATEDSFAALVADHTDDGGSAATGGLYDDVTPTSNYVEEFRAWAVDAARKTGDTGIVKTQFGYHIMYFVGGREIWLDTASADLLGERFNKFMNDAFEAYPITIEYEKIVLGNVSLA